MKILFKASIDPKKIKETDYCGCIYINIYLDKNKQFPLIEVDLHNTNLLHKLGISRFICIDGGWVREMQYAPGFFFHKFKGVKYHDNFDEEPFKNGYLDLYIKDKKAYI